MKLNELNEWKLKHQYITTEVEHPDSSGNVYAEEIFQNKENGKFFAVDYLNGLPYETTRNVYSEPRQVFKRTILIDVYDDREECENLVR